MIMRITGSVKVFNRNLPSLNLNSKKASRSSLTIGTLPGKNKSLFILLQTLENGSGVKYKVNGNVESVFSKFINDGKATIRFTTPPHDLIIQSNSSELKSFLKTLNHMIKGGKIGSCSLLTGAPCKVTPTPKTKLIISSKQELPVLKGYPRSLTYLQINNAGLPKIEGRILRLQNLQILNVSNNNITVIPPQLDLLLNLKELYLSNNKLGEGTDWRWMQSKHIHEKLVLLDLSNNMIKLLPRPINRFKALRTLLLDNNRLTTLPNGLGLLSSLRVLHVKNNMIQYIPSSCRFLRLDLIDMSGNLTFLNTFSVRFPPIPDLSLLDRAATVLLASRQHYDCEVVPWTLVDYLESANYCVCGSPVLPPSVVAAVPFDLSRIALSVTLTHSTNPLIGITFCSPKCRANAYLMYKLIFRVDL